MNTTRQKFFVVALATFFIAGCGKKITDLSIVSTGKKLALGTLNQDTLRWINTGTAGVVVQYKNTGIIIDPFVSNQPLSKCGVKVSADENLANAVFNDDVIKHTKAVLLGHGHYDHAMDIVPLSKKLDSNTTVLCSNSTKNLLAPLNFGIYPETDILIHKDSQATNWIYLPDSSARVMCFKSLHPPHILGITLYSGSQKKPRKTLPDYFSKWKMGHPLTFLIDFLENGKPVFRIFSQSSSAKGNMGLPPAAVLLEKSVDVCFSAAALPKHKTEYLDTTLQRIRPNVFVLTHWENFFKKYDEAQPEGVLKADIQALYERLKEQYGNSCALLLPKPFSKYELVK